METVTFTYTYTDEDGHVTQKTSHTVNGDDCLTHDEVADNFNQFLRGAGYFFRGCYSLGA